MTRKPHMVSVVICLRYNKDTNTSFLVSLARLQAYTQEPVHYITLGLQCNVLMLCCFRCLSLLTCRTLAAVVLGYKVRNCYALSVLRIIYVGRYAVTPLRVLYPTSKLARAGRSIAGLWVGHCPTSKLFLREFLCTFISLTSYRGPSSKVGFGWGIKYLCQDLTLSVAIAIASIL